MEMCGLFYAPASVPVVEEPWLHIEGWPGPRVSLDVARSFRESKADSSVVQPVAQILYRLRCFVSFTRRNVLKKNESS